MGSSPIIHDLSHIGILDYSSSSVNKFGYASEPSGTIRFRCNSIITDPRKAGRLENSLRTSSTNVTLSATQLLKQQQVRQTVEDILQNYRSTTFAERLSRSMSQSQSALSQIIPTRTSTLGSTLTSVSSSISKSDFRGASIIDALNANERAARVAQILAQAKAKSAGVKSKDEIHNKPPFSSGSGSNSGAENDSLQINLSSYAQSTTSGEEREPLLQEPSGNLPSPSRLGSTSSSVPLDNTFQSAILLPTQAGGIASRNRKASLRYAINHDDDDEEDSFLRSYVDEYGH